MAFYHCPVLLNESLMMLNCKPGGRYIDCTLGGAGHTEAILKATAPDGKVIGIDRDREAIAAAQKKLAAYGERVLLVHANFKDIAAITKDLKISAIDGILFDLGVSSYQLDVAERGFTYQQDAPLDMRMDISQMTTAADLVNNLSEEELAKLIYEYSEEHWAKRIAKFIVEERKKRPITSTQQLVKVIKNAIPAEARREGPHPAKRTFQALRIAVNHELEIIEEAICQAVELLKKGGRICVITFHSLEDRIVKQTFQRLSKGCTCPPGLPICACGKQPVVSVITKKPILPQTEEIESNSRARSAKLRAAEKLA